MELSTPDKELTPCLLYANLNKYFIKTIPAKWQGIKFNNHEKIHNHINGLIVYFSCMAKRTNLTLTILTASPMELLLLIATMGLSLAVSASRKASKDIRTTLMLLSMF